MSAARVTPPIHPEARLAELEQAIERHRRACAAGAGSAAARDQELYRTIFDEHELPRADAFLAQGACEDPASRRALALERAIHSHWAESTHGLTARMDWADGVLHGLLSDAERRGA